MAARAGQERTPLRVSLLCGLAAGALLVALVVPFLGRYGWDRDELYYLAASRHLALGYVDYPPLVAVLGWAVREVFGDSLDALRVSCLLCGVGSVVLVALSARELGGGLRTQLGAALAWALTPYVLGSASIFHPTWLDLLAWSAFGYLALRILARPEPRLWPWLGVVAGLGLEAKYTIAALVLAFAMGLLLTRARTLLRTRGPWIAAAIALAILAPNLGWQIAHGWPSVHFLGSQNQTTAEETPRFEFALEQLLFLGAAAVLSVIGVVRLWRDERLRPLALVPVIVTLIFFLSRGRGYYPLPADSVAVAAGAVAVAGWLRGANRRRWALAALALLQAAVLVVVAPVVVPVLPTATMISRKVYEPSFYDAEIGWPEFTAATARAWDSLPAAERRREAIVTSNYGEAGALALMGPALGLPTPLSGHLSWQYWRPASLPQRAVVLVGFAPGFVARHCDGHRLLGRARNRWHIENEERGARIVQCRLPATLGSLWGRDFATNQL
ncbi:MAG TPA: glycosyltransferase family 39 protein [Solirubrobacterales bacterium]|nr:glycosyltransferase family 39 protein [Solirubrobacterales bacterium]